MQEQVGALGYCPTCKEMMITENGVPKCFNCVSRKPKGPSKHIAVDIPSEKAFNDIVGIEAKSPQPVVMGTAKMVATGHTAQDALDIMKQLPMPKNMQEFKQIQKIIKQLEKLVGENNG